MLLLEKDALSAKHRDDANESRDVMQSSVMTQAQQTTQYVTKLPNIYVNIPVLCMAVDTICFQPHNSLCDVML